MSDGLEVDVRAVASVGARMVRSAEVLRQQAIDAGRLEFGGVQAGRDYCALGDEMRNAQPTRRPSVTSSEPAPRVMQARKVPLPTASTGCFHDDGCGFVDGRSDAEP
jgi:hypothetical protein